MNEHALYSFCLSRVKGVGSRTAAQLLEEFGSAKEIFDSSISELRQRVNLSNQVVENIRQFREFDLCASELNELKSFGIRIITPQDSSYPVLLHHIPDRPVVLFVKGEDQAHMRNVAIVGTRIPSDRAGKMVRELVGDLSGSNCNIVSGLAYGVDRMAHECALDFGLPTTAVLGHSLDRIYPHSHSALARSIAENKGCLISEHPLGTKPDRENFPMRNRIVAGMCDATIVVESKARGGSLITADLAFQYNREVFAVPGRPDDETSEGCVDLIRQNKARICTSANDIISALNWDLETASKRQRELPLDLSEEQQSIWKVLQDAAPLHIDELLRLTGMKNAEIATELLSLEMRGLIQQKPGNTIDIR